MHRLPLVTRSEWGADPARSRVPLKHPVSNVVFCFNPGVPPCYDQEGCIRTVKTLQERHLGMGLVDIHYNFIVGGDGLLYEGRGWHFQSSRSPESPTTHGDRIDIGYIGDFDVDPFQPNHVMTPPGLRLIHYGMNFEYIKDIYNVAEDINAIQRQPNLKEDESVL